MQGTRDLNVDAKIACAWRTAANFDERAKGARIELLVLHYTGMQSGEGALDWLCAAQSRVSCHYFVFCDGRVVQLVSEAKRAWHAGASSWRGMDDLNSRSIGIEIANPGHEYGYRRFPKKQIEAVIALGGDIVRRNGIKPADVVAHSDIAPKRKQDPGELFPWRLLHSRGIGRWVPASRATRGETLMPGQSGSQVQALQQMLQACGYAIEASGVYDPLTVATVTAFQRHWRPASVDGIADPSTRRTLHRLLQA